ncbi:hypothetical protein VF21_00524 [Pseudogymnoascus sp. 05NY08]|nr:hypothetical protein VF21_00524 [Pseudogymnoascus sp. 05NY08]
MIKRVEEYGWDVAQSSETSWKNSGSNNKRAYMYCVDLHTFATYQFDTPVSLKTSLLQYESILLPAMESLGLDPLCCILCGALIPLDNADSPPWMHSFRAIYTVNDACDRACVSAVGIRRDDPDSPWTLCHASLWWPRDDPSLKGGHVTGHDGAITRHLNLNSPPRRFQGTGEIFWGFSFHSACWDLLTKLRPWGLLDTQAIFDICRSVPARGGVLLIGHDYGGICEPDSKFATYPGEKPQRILHRVKPRSHELIMGEALENPLEVPGLPLIFEKGSTDYADNYFTNVLKILELIVTELTLEDVSQLKQASQIYANLVLPDTFWHSQFRRGGEFEHVFESMEYGSQCKGRWRLICLKAKELKSHPAILNRKRIVKLAWDLLDLVDRRGKISCSMLDSPPSLLGYSESSTPIGPLKWVTASRSLLPRNENFDHDTRCLYRLTVDVPSDIASVFISTIDVFGLLYISGIRFEQKSGASTELGFNSRRIREESVGSRSSQLQEGYQTEWESTTAFQGDDWFPIEPNEKIALKLVTLSVAGKDDTETDVHSRHNDEPPAPQDVNIWYPEIPDPSLSFIGVPGLPAAYRYGQDEMPLSTILFGGLKGELLCHIVKMTVWISDMTPGNYVVLGIGFTFDCPVEGKSSPVLGHSRDDGEYDFPIDGRGGERICQMDKIFQYTWASHLRFRIHTTQRRTFEFPPTNFQLSLRECPVTKSLPVSDGTIVGFCSRMSEQITPNNTGLVYIKDPVDESPPE